MKEIKNLFMIPAKVAGFEYEINGKKIQMGRHLTEGYLTMKYDGHTFNPCGSDFNKHPKLTDEEIDRGVELTLEIQALAATAADEFYKVLEEKGWRINYDD